MWTIATDVPIAWYASQSVHQTPAKMAEWIEVLFRSRLLAPMNIAIDVGPDPPMGSGMGMHWHIPIHSPDGATFDAASTVATC